MSTALATFFWIWASSGPISHFSCLVPNGIKLRRSFRDSNVDKLSYADAPPNRFNKLSSSQHSCYGQQGCADRVWIIPFEFCMKKMVACSLSHTLWQGKKCKDFLQMSCKVIKLRPFANQEVLLVSVTSRQLQPVKRRPCLWMNKWLCRSSSEECTTLVFFLQSQQGIQM